MTIVEIWYIAFCAFSLLFLISVIVTEEAKFRSFHRKNKTSIQEIKNLSSVNDCLNCPWRIQGQMRADRYGVQNENN